MFTLSDLMGASEGQFAMFVGGKDVGKSLMLAKLAESLAKQGRRVVIVDARDNATISLLVSSPPPRAGRAGSRMCWPPFRYPRAKWRLSPSRQPRC